MVKPKAEDLFNNSLKWLRKNYKKQPFFTERDIVWTLQKYLRKKIEHKKLSYKVYNDWPIEKSSGRRSKCVDLAIVEGKEIIVVAEFKYEPDHKRKEDFSENKLRNSVVSWSAVCDDVKRAKCFAENKVKFAFSVFIDEGGKFRKENVKGLKRKEIKDASWEDWGKSCPSVFIGRFSV